ncbi:endonuclease domain-containing protein [Streptomyces sp. NPDC002666]
MRHLPRVEAVVVADSALSTRRVHGVRRPPLVLLAALHDELASRCHGAARARALLPALDPGSGSPAETVARLLLRDAGLRPETQAALHTPTGRNLRPDFLFRTEGLIVEVEGYDFHGTREAHAEDVRRFNELQSCPEIRRVLRFTATDIYRHPRRVLREITATLQTLRLTPH